MLATRHAPAAAAGAHSHSHSSSSAARAPAGPPRQQQRRRHAAAAWASSSREGSPSSSGAGAAGADDEAALRLAAGILQQHEPPAAAAAAASSLDESVTDDLDPLLVLEDAPRDVKEAALSAAVAILRRADKKGKDADVASSSAGARARRLLEILDARPTTADDLEEGHVSAFWSVDDSDQEEGATPSGAPPLLLRQLGLSGSESDNESDSSALLLEARWQQYRDALETVSAAASCFASVDEEVEDAAGSGGGGGGGGNSEEDDAAAAAAEEELLRRAVMLLGGASAAAAAAKKKQQQTPADLPLSPLAAELKRQRAPASRADLERAEKMVLQQSQQQRAPDKDDVYE